MKILEARGVETVSRRFYAREDHRDEDSTLFLRTLRTKCLIAEERSSYFAYPLWAAYECCYTAVSGHFCAECVLSSSAYFLRQ